MATLQTYYNQMPNDLQLRFNPAVSSYWVAWCNQMLEELSGRGLMPLLKFESGVLPEKKIWINKPAGLRTMLRICSPLDIDKWYSFEEVNDKFKLLNAIFDDTTAISPDEIISYAAGSISVTFEDEYEENSFENYLLVVTDGDMAGKTIVLSGNSAPDEHGYIQLNFLHSLSSIPDEDNISEIAIYSPEQYLMIKWTGSYVPLTSISEEVPVDDKYELRLVPAYLNWCAQKRLSSTSRETAQAKAEVDEILFSIGGERMRQLMGPAQGRRLVGYER